MTTQTLIPQPQAPGHSRKPKGKIAQLPKNQRDLINQMLDGGATYAVVAAESTPWPVFPASPLTSKNKLTPKPPNSKPSTPTRALRQPVRPLGQKKGPLPHDALPNPLLQNRLTILSPHQPSSLSPYQTHE